MKIKNDLSKINFTDFNSFIKQNMGKPVIAVQGLGFVGSVMSLVCSNALTKDYSVLGVDVPEMEDRINSLNQGIFPLEAEDPKIEIYFRNAREGKFLCNI